MGPVSPEGWRVTGVFVMSVVAGSLGGFLLLTSGRPLEGLAVYLVLVAMGGLTYLLLARARGDRERTVEDYQMGRGRNDAPQAPTETMENKKSDHPHA
jgi:hypothetical protein